MNFDIKSYGLFMIFLLLTVILEKDNKLDKYLPKNKMFYTIIFSIMGGLFGGIITYYNINISQHQIFLIWLVAFRTMHIIIIKSQQSNINFYEKKEL